MSMQFINVDEDGETVVSFSFDKECWLDTFPIYLKFLRAAGFSISDSVKLYAPDVVKVVRSTRGFLFDSEDNAKVTPSNSQHYYDKDRNK